MKRILKNIADKIEPTQIFLTDKFIEKVFPSNIEKQYKKNRVNLIWWNEKKNLGDYLAYVIYQWILKEKGIDADQKQKNTKYLTTVGSVMNLTRSDTVVWGSGILDVSSIPPIYRKSCYRKLDIRAVRGPITRHILVSAGYKCPPVYGDPAILMPLIYKGKSSDKKYKVSVIQHHSKMQSEVEGLNYIDIKTNDYEFFIDEILASEKVVSSSLHGIILAETYGVPAVFLNDGMESSLLKFYDWYLSTGRGDVKIASCLEEAINMEPMALPDLSKMQKQLLECFPTDLWEQ